MVYDVNSFFLNWLAKVSLTTASSDGCVRDKLTVGRQLMACSPLNCLWWHLALDLRVPGPFVRLGRKLVTPNSPCFMTLMTSLEVVVGFEQLLLTH